METSTTEIYTYGHTLSLHDALPISGQWHRPRVSGRSPRAGRDRQGDLDGRHQHQPRIRLGRQRSEEHTSELQSLMRNSYAVFCLKKQITTITIEHTNVNNKIYRTHMQSNNTIRRKQYVTQTT